MKKALIIALLLLVAFSFGQTVKKKKSKKTVEQEVVKISEPNKEVSEDYPPASHPGKYSTSDSIIEYDQDVIYGFEGIEVKPEYVGGQKIMINFIIKNYVLSKEMIDAKIKGKIFIAFVVEKDGSLSDIKVIRDIGFGTGPELLRVFKLMPKWNPGEQNGSKVRVLYSMPYTINGDN